jgi:hypothetical protein
MYNTRVWIVAALAVGLAGCSKDHECPENAQCESNGNILTEEFDIDGDGTVDLRSTYTYDADGNVLTEESDIGGDGTVDLRSTYTYDADGNRLTRESDVGGDGTVDSRCTYNPPCPPEEHRAEDQSLSCPEPTCR